MFQTKRAQVEKMVEIAAMIAQGLAMNISPVDRHRIGDLAFREAKAIVDAGNDLLMKLEVNATAR